MSTAFLRPSSRAWHTLGLLLLALAGIAFTVRGFRVEREFMLSRDFKPLYVGARCVLHHESPYDVGALRREFLAAGGSISEDPVPFEPYYALYPPPAFVLVTPLAFLPWHAAHLVWFALLAGLMIGAAFIVAEFCTPCSLFLIPALISLFILGAHSMLLLGQPSGVSIGLCVLGTVLLLQRRHTALAVAAFAASLILKPHTGFFLLIYFMMSARYRKQGWTIALVTAAFCIPVLLYFSLSQPTATWLHDLRINLAHNQLHGGLSDPGPTNPDAYYIVTLQSALALFRDSKPFYNTAAWTICAPLLLLWLWGAWKIKPSFRKDAFAIAAITSLSLLPIYHRDYDTKLLLLCFPAIALLLHDIREISAVPNADAAPQRSRRLRLAALATLLIIFVENDRFSYRLVRHMVAVDPAHPIRTLLFLRNVPLVILCEGILYLILLLRLLKPKQQDVDTGLGYVSSHAGVLSARGS